MQRPPFSYDFSHTCEYMKIKDEQLSDDKYREEILRVFNLEVFDEAMMGEKIDQLAGVIKGDAKFANMCSKSANRYLSEDFGIGLTLLFSFDSFHLIHACLQDFNDHGEVDDKHYNLVLSYLEN